MLHSTSPSKADSNLQLAPQKLKVIFSVLKMVSYIKEKEDLVLYLLNVC